VCVCRVVRQNLPQCTKNASQRVAPALLLTALVKYCAIWQAMRSYHRPSWTAVGNAFRYAQEGGPRRHSTMACGSCAWPARLPQYFRAAASCWGRLLPADAAGACRCAAQPAVLTAAAFVVASNWWQLRAQHAVCMCMTSSCFTSAATQQSCS
jgi:hypothetical protein